MSHTSPLKRECGLYYRDAVNSQILIDIFGVDCHVNNIILTLIGPDQLTNTSTPSSEQGSTSPETTMRLGMKRDRLLPPPFCTTVQSGVTFWDYFHQRSYIWQKTRGLCLPLGPEIRWARELSQGSTPNYTANNPHSGSGLSFTMRPSIHGRINRCTLSVSPSLCPSVAYHPFARNWRATEISNLAGWLPLLWVTGEAILRTKS